MCVQKGSFLLLSGLCRLEEFRVKMGTTVREIYIVPWLPMFVDQKYLMGFSCLADGLKLFGPVSTAVTD